MILLLYFDKRVIFFEAPIFSRKNFFSCSYLYWHNFCWIHRLPLLLGGFCNVWATLLATILPRTPSRLNRFDLARYPILVNSFFIIIPILLLSAIIPAIVIINNKFNQAYQLAKELQIILEQASDLFVQKGIITDLVGFNQSILSLENLFKGLYVYWERVWILYAVFVGICWIVRLHLLVYFWFMYLLLSSFFFVDLYGSSLRPLASNSTFFIHPSI